MTNPGSSAGAPGTIEFVNPDRYHIVTSGFESIQIGTDVRVRMGSGPWQCSGQSARQPVTDPGGMSGEVEVARGPDVGIDGVQTRSYTYTWKPSAGAAAPPGVNLTIKTRLFVASASGLPKRVQILDKDDQVQTQFDYYDYGAPIAITLPNCQ
jgi:hypothetical protein